MTHPIVQSLDAIDRALQYSKEYLSDVPHRSVAPSSEAISALQVFDEPMPNVMMDTGDVLKMLHQFGSPATTTTTGGRFFGLVVGGAFPAALGARMLTSAWDQIVLNDSTSPIGVTLEKVTSRWLLDVLSLPETSSVGFVTGATMGNFTCLAGARQHLLAKQSWDISKDGLRDAPRIRLVAGEQTHITALKALSLLGFGRNEIEWVASDDQGRIDLSALPPLDDRTIVLTQAGNVNSGAIDPIEEICHRANGAWVHVDGAFGLWAAASSRYEHLLDGYEHADSWVTDGHKWLNTPYECGMAICRHPGAVHAAMATQAPYLQAGNMPAPKDMVPEFSRSARGAMVWATLKALGRDGLADLITRTCNHALALADGLREQGFEVLNEVVLNQVVVTLNAPEGWANKLSSQVQRSGEAWFGPTHWRGREAIRFSVASWSTTEDDIERTLRAIEAERNSLC